MNAHLPAASGRTVCAIWGILLLAQASLAQAGTDAPNLMSEDLVTFPTAQTMLLAIALGLVLVSTLILFGRVRALRDSHERYRALFDNTGNGVAVYQGKDNGTRFVFRDMNAAGKRLTHTEDMEILGKDATDIFPDMERFGLLDVLKDVWKTGESRRLPVRHYRDHRTTAWFENQVYKLSSGELVTVFTDVSKVMRDEREREKLLIDLGERFKELTCMYGVSEAIRTHTKLDDIFEDVVALIPPGWQYPEITCARIVFEGKTCDSQPFAKTPWCQTSGIVVNGETRGAVEVYYTEERPAADEGPFLKEERDLIEGISRTLSEAIERTRAEEESRNRQGQLMQADKMAALGILVSGVAHEINNPNHLVMANAQQISKAWAGALPILDEFYEENGEFMLGGLRYSETRERIASMCSGILEGSQSIKLIVEELRDYARQDSGDQAGLVSMNKVAEAACRLLGNLVGKHTKRFEVALDESIPPVWGNAQRLEQVVINLVQNACQALPDREKGIRLTTTYDADAGEVCLCVTDEGVGISEENMKHLLDPFFTTKRDSGGTGLGLSISFTIMREHNGRLEFRSSPYNGTIATMAVPARGKD